MSLALFFHLIFFFFFFFNDTATTEIYTLSLHDALPISRWCAVALARARPQAPSRASRARARCPAAGLWDRSEEHTSELQSQSNLVCRLLLEKKKKKKYKKQLIGEKSTRIALTCHSARND